MTTFPIHNLLHPDRPVMFGGVHLPMTILSASKSVLYPSTR